MTNFIKALLWFILLAIIATIAHYLWGQHLCDTCDKDNTKVAVGEWSEFAIADADGKTLFKFPQGFLINNKDGSVEIAEGMSGFKDSIFNYLNTHQGKELLITGKYNKEEGEPVGLDRANFLKDLLVKFGINPDKIIPSAHLKDFSFDANGKFNDGVGFAFHQISDNRLKLVEENIANKTLYSDFGDEDFKPDNTLVGYAYELKNYLSKYPGKKVVVTGHTDNVGEPDTNYNLGLARAKNVAEYLMNHGVEKNDITYLSKGEKEPVADNSTDEGRAKNRRITVVVK